MKTTLVLEDELSILKIVRLVLSKEYVVLESTSAAEAFQQFHKHDGNIILLITDVILREKFGTQVALKLREQNPALKIILTSGYPQSMWPDSERAEIQNLPSDSVAILDKPFFPATLLKTINEMLGPSAELACDEAAHPA
jgi:CheY-like chemotaxis protein